ncbi:hypothetical protein BDV98DRAFT_572420 [Pterulicium gracile]|uniref:Uncharacterized protein n=1 Tax=Pterulicium gracile TaxID=1884261 RepID=A0A5C3QDV8_9AGAR|nr:hypothetical protein BDV98DRAFT_572420 [Pterula gracilis]
MEYWDAHPSVCPKRRDQYTFAHSTMDQSTAITRGVKRRRAKRTQEERIAYLRDDPYVAQYEAYKVLCASCNKWIRLRPNSTYCSIPWDAHRKSCLARKLPKNSSSVDDRNEALRRDPDVLNYDAQQVHCRICSNWVNISPHDHVRGMQMWLQHRSSCRSNTANVRSGYPTTHPPPPAHQQTSMSARDAGPNFFSRPGSSSASMSHSGGSTCSRSPIILPPLEPKSLSLSRRSPLHSPATSHASASPKPREDGWNTSEEGQPHRFHGASQRELELRADPYIKAVERHQVLCRLCERWVRLMPDSAQLWVQHREQCLAKRGSKSEAIEGVIPTDHQAEHCHRRRSVSSGKRRREDGSEDGDDSDSMHVDELARYRVRHPAGVTTPVASSVSARTRLVEPISISPRQSRVRGSRRTSNAFDISSQPNRTSFVLTSIQHLFQSSYEPTDVLSFSSLLAYLNTAMPPDKFEEFETPEVAKIVYSLSQKRRIVVEGDNLRPVFD